MSILAKCIKEVKDAAEHADQVVNELLIVFSLLFRPCKIFSGSIPQNITLMECF